MSIFYDLKKKFTIVAFITESHRIQPVRDLTPPGKGESSLYIEEILKESHSSHLSDTGEHEPAPCKIPTLKLQTLHLRPQLFFEWY